MTKKQRAKINQKNIDQCLTQLWHELNETRFLGSLKKTPKFTICQNPRFLAAYSFKMNNKKIYSGTIIFSEKLFYRASKKLFTDALLHEMAHQFCIEVLKLPKEGHGLTWQLICIAIGAKPYAKTPWWE